MLGSIALSFGSFSGIWEDNIEHESAVTRLCHIVFAFDSQTLNPIPGLWEDNIEYESTVTGLENGDAVFVGMVIQFLT